MQTSVKISEKTKIEKNKKSKKKKRKKKVKIAILYRPAQTDCKSFFF